MEALNLRLPDSADSPAVSTNSSVASNQTGDPAGRATLIDWLIEVHLRFKLMLETLILTTNLIDRYFCVQSVSRKDPLLVGITAMLLAAKYGINDFIHILDNAYELQ